MQASFVAVDVETANADLSSVCQLGAVRVEGGVVRESFSSLVDPQAFFDDWNVEIHGITEAAVRGQPVFAEVAPQLEEFIGHQVVVSHTAFDRVAIERAHERYQLKAPAWTWLDTARVARRAWTQFAESGYGLANLAKHCGVEFQQHNAAEDARAAAEILLRAMRDSGLQVTEWLARVRRPIDPSASVIAREGDSEGFLAGEVVLFTGALSIRRADAAAMAASAGCKVKEGAVSRSVTMLVVGQQDLSKLAGYTKSTKQRAAEVLISQGAPIAVLGEHDFLRLIEHAQAMRTAGADS